MHHKESARDPVRPTPGYYLVRLAPRAWMVPAVIRLTCGRYTAEVDGEAVAGSWTADEIEQLLFDWLTAEAPHPFVRLTLYGQLTDEPTYRYRLAMKDWARLHRPNHPCLRPGAPMDPNTLEATDF